MSKRIVPSSPAKPTKIPTKVYQTRSRIRSLSAALRDPSPDAFNSPENSAPFTMSPPNDENQTPETDFISRKEFLLLFDKLINKLDKPEPPQPSRLTLFLQQFSKAWVPLKLNSDSMVLYSRLKLILEFANYNTTRGSNFVLAVLDDSDQSRMHGQILLQSENITREDWYNQFLIPFGPFMSSIIRQLSDTKPFPDETIEACVHRLSLCSIRQAAHPCETLAVNKLIAVLTAVPELSPIAVNRPPNWEALLTEILTICSQYKNATDIDLKHPTFRKPQPPSTSSTS